MRLNIDFETRSPVPLKKSGVYPYALHPETGIWCMAYAFGDDEPEVWTPDSALIPPDVIGHVLHGGHVRAWNANFERLIWNMILAPRFGFPKLTIEQLHDTMAEAVAMALPRHLGQCAAALGLEQQKDDVGHRLMLKMSRPKKGGGWHDDPEDLARLIEYCRQDVRTERAIGKLMVPLTKAERETYILDQRINDRGVRIDVPLVQVAQDLVSLETDRANARISEITEGDATSITQVAALTVWLKDQGLAIDNLQKQTVIELLKDDSLPPEVREALLLRQDAGRTSLAKWNKVDDVLCPDDRARGMLLYHAASTGRWAGRLIQPQNFPRPYIPDYQDYVPRLLAGEALDLDLPEGISMMDVLVSNLRSMFVPARGHRFLSADYSQIEARITCWYGGETFRDHEYERMAGAIYGVPWEEIGKDSEERQIGKNTVLGAGFGMGAAKFVDYVYKATGIEPPIEMAQKAIDTYREQKAGVKNYWYTIEGAAKRAVMNPGEVVSLGSIKYVVRSQFLWCILPSRRPLAYALPEIRMRETPWGEMRPSLTAMGVNTYTRKWQRNTLYGGLLTENVVQATARDVMVEGMKRLEAAGYPIVLTVHDEILAEVPDGHGSLEDFKSIMSEVPAWAPGLPVEVEGKEGTRWRK